MFFKKRTPNEWILCPTLGGHFNHHRLPSSQNDAVQAWLTDGKQGEENILPPALERYCKLIDEDNWKKTPATASEEDRAEIKSATKKILFAAKENGVGVKFIENEYTDLGNDNDRHKHLLVALSDLQKENPNKKFILLCGANRENRSMNDGITFSDALGADSCEIANKELYGTVLSPEVTTALSTIADSLKEGGVTVGSDNKIAPSQLKQSSSENEL